MTSQEFWAAHSPVTSPGTSHLVTSAIAAIPNNSLSTLRNATSQHIFHFLNSNYADKGVPPSRRSEISLRYASSILETLVSREASLTATRDNANRAVGCARDSVVTFLCLARERGIPARGRVGFTSMFGDAETDSEGWWLDHVIAEVWDAGESRWRMVETRMASRKEGDDRDDSGRFNLLDLTEAEFLTAPKAWKAVQEGKLDAAKFGVDADDNLPPFLKGWHYLAHNLLHDLVWLDKKEMLLWDHWGVQDGMSKKTPEAVREELSGLLGEISAVTADTGVEPAAVRALAQREGLRVPGVITSVDAAGGMVEVDVSRTIGE